MSSRSMNMIWLRREASRALPSQLQAAFVISPRDDELRLQLLPAPSRELPHDRSPQLRGGAASGNRTPDLLNTSVSRHRHHLANSLVAAPPPSAHVRECPPRRYPIATQFVTLAPPAETQGARTPNGDTGVGLQQDGGGVRASRRVGELVSERAGG